MNMNLRAVIFDGRAAADAIADSLATRILAAKLQPHFADFAVEADQPTIRYMKTKAAVAERLGITMETINLPADEAAVGAAVKQAAADASMAGVMIQLPLPATLGTQAILTQIPDSKDVDGLNFVSRGGRGIVPATVLAIAEILHQAGVDLAQPKITHKIIIVGHGELVGKPLALYLRGHQSQKADCTVVDEHTVDLAEQTQAADVIVSAVGQPHLITAEMIKPGAIIIDAGVSIINGQSVGDVDFDQVKAQASFITPPTGGVGPMTVVMLMRNVIEAATLTNSVNSSETK